MKPTDEIFGGGTATARVRERADLPRETAGVQPTHEDIARLAYQYWVEGGQRQGTAEDDWQRAERELRRRPQTSTATRR